MVTRKTRIFTILLWCLIVLQSSLYGKSSVITLTNPDDRALVSQVIKQELRKKDTVVVYKEDNGSGKLYSISLNGANVWSVTSNIPLDDFDAMFIKATHFTTTEKNRENKKEKSRGSFQVTPWQEITPFYKKDSIKTKVLDMFAWKSGGEINFYRDHFYNFNNPAGDTTTPKVYLGKPAMYSYKMDMSYTYRYKLLWVGGGISRNYQLSSNFDTLQVDRGSWWSRMGWNIHIAGPGIRYDMFRDPSLIPYYSQYEDSIYTKLYPDALYGFTKPLPITVDSVDAVVLNPYTGQPIVDTLTGDTLKTKIQKNKLSMLGGISHKITLKFGYFRYAIIAHPRAYYRPINIIEMVDLPFFKGEWDIGIKILPDGRVIPHGAIDFYRTSIPVKVGYIGISPLHFELEVWGRNTFFMSLGFNMEYVHSKATFYKEK